MVNELAEPAWTVSRKERAIRAGLDAARFHDCNLTVVGADGTPRTISPASRALPPS